MKRIYLIFLCLVFILCGCQSGENKNIIIENNDKGAQSANESSDNSYFNLCVTRATAAKMLAVVFSDDIENAAYCGLDDIGRGNWYDKYVNAVCRDKIMSGDGQNFNPDEPLSYGQAQEICKHVGIKTGKNIKNSDEAISLRLWLDMLFGGIDLKQHGIERKDISIFATAETGGMDAYKTATSIGVLDHSGINIDFCIDKTIEVFIKNGEIAAINNVKCDTADFQNVYMCNNGENNCEFLLNYGTRQFENPSYSETGFYDITVDSGEIQNMQPVSEKITDRIISFDGSKFELENKGNINKDECFNAVSTYNGAKTASISELISGCNYDFYLKNGKISAALISEKYQPEKMRVIISSDNGYFHDNVIFTDTSGIDIYKAGTKVNTVNKLDMSDSDICSSGRVTLVPVSGKITLDCDDRNRASKDFYGEFDIEKTDNGYLVINEVNFEDYVKGVIPSEMPSGYGSEAAKVQAVCARSYGYNEFYSNEYLNYGANCDDTVMCQVYNSSLENETSDEAADVTKGTCICYNDEVVSANFYASSCGTGASSCEVWAKNGTFPSDTKPYLSYRNDDNVDFTSENAALSYFEDTNTKSYDSWSKWFRWNVTFSLSQLENTVKNNLPGIYDKNRTINGNYNLPEKCSDFLSSAGHLKDMEITKRGHGGNVMALKLIFDNKDITVYTEYNIRCLLRPKGYGGDTVNLNLKDGTVLKNYSILPSAFFAIETWQDANNKNFVLVGGGIGHGCGMSQNGVKGMSDDGFKMEDIIKYYYNGAKVKQMIQ